MNKDIILVSQLGNKIDKISPFVGFTTAKE